MLSVYVHGPLPPLVAMWAIGQRPVRAAVTILGHETFTCTRYVENVHVHVLST